MPDNDFLEFGAASGANVEDQADYAADPHRTAGFQTGVAPSGPFNKVWRQATAIVSALAQLVSDTLTVDMFDNGDRADKITKISNMIKSLAWTAPALTGAATAPTVAGTTDNTTKIATTAFVQAVRALLAPLASPTFTGVPAAPTASFGTNTTQLATTAFVQAALAVTRSYNSSPAAIAFPGTIGPLTHSLAGVPRILCMWLVCTTAEGGYNIGDIITCPIYGSYSGESRGARALVNTTTISIRFGGDPIEVPNASTGASFAITAANWNFYLNAFN